MEISSQNLAHVLLSAKEDYTLLSAKWGETNIYDTIVIQLQKLVKREKHPIAAHIFYSVNLCL